MKDKVKQSSRLATALVSLGFVVFGGLFICGNEFLKIVTLPTLETMALLIPILFVFGIVMGSSTVRTQAGKLQILFGAVGLALWITTISESSHSVCYLPTLF